MRPRALDELKQQIPLLEYLQSREWRPVRALRGWSLAGTVSAAHRSQAEFPGRFPEEPVLLLWLRPGR